MIQKLLGASSKPKILAIMSAIALIVGQVGALIDADTKTVPDISLCVTQVLIIAALFQTRQNSVTSEQVRDAAKPVPRRK